MAGAAVTCQRTGHRKSDPCSPWRGGPAGACGSSEILRWGGVLHSGKQVPHVEESAQKVELVCLGVEERMGKSYS